MEKSLPDPSSPLASTPLPRLSCWTIGTETYALTLHGHRTSSAICLTPAMPMPAWSSGASINNLHGKYSPTVIFHPTISSPLIFEHTTSRACSHAHVTLPHACLHRPRQYATTPTALILLELKHLLITISPPLPPLGRD